jgi:hypothetical protein
MVVSPPVSEVESARLDEVLAPAARLCRLESTMIWENKFAKSVPLRALPAPPEPVELEFGPVIRLLDPAPVSDGDKRKDWLSIGALISDTPHQCKKRDRNGFATLTPLIRLQEIPSTFNGTKIAWNGLS